MTNIQACNPQEAAEEFLERKSSREKVRKIIVVPQKHYKEFYKQELDYV